MSAESEYEQRRRANIARNQELLRQLGLSSSDVEAHLQAFGEKNGNICHRIDSKTSIETKKRKLDREAEAQPQRASARLAGKAPAFEGLDFCNYESITAESKQGEAATCEAHEQEERDHLRWAGKQRKVIYWQSACIEKSNKLQ
jgi:hypothetical protein